MVTKKATVKVKSAVLKFNPDWIRDPPPPFFKNIDKLRLKELAQAKRDFANRVKEILKGQR